MATFQSVRKFRVTSLHFTIIMSVNYEVRIYGNLVQMKLLLCWNIWDIFYNLCLEWNRSPISNCSKKLTNSLVFFGYFKLEPRLEKYFFIEFNARFVLMYVVWICLIQDDFCSQAFSGLPIFSKIWSRHSITKQEHFIPNIFI